MQKFFVFTVLFLSLIVRVQAHTFLPTSDFIEGYETYIKGKNLSISLVRIGAYYGGYDDYERLDYTNPKDPILLGIRNNSLPERYSHTFLCRDFKFDILGPDNKAVGKIILQEAEAKTYDSFFYITNVNVARKHQGKGVGTRALKEFIHLFEAINPHCKRFSLVVYSENQKAALVYARAGFWLSDCRTGKKTKDIGSFADIILDQTQTNYFKVMIRERGDALIAIPSAYKDDKQEIITRLLAAQEANQKPVVVAEKLPKRDTQVAEPFCHKVTRLMFRNFKFLSRSLWTCKEYVRITLSTSAAVATTEALA